MTDATDKISRKTQFGTMDNTGKVTKVMEIDLQKVKSDDPLAYAYGLFEGKSGRKMSKAGRGDKLAPEYVRGFKDGKKQAGK